jgi:hypothetical protein
LPRIAAEFVRLKVDLIVTSGGGVPAAKQATSVIQKWFRRQLGLFQLCFVPDRLETLKRTKV